MEEEVLSQSSSIFSLPNEILTLILQYNDCQDIAAFGATCKRFWEMVQNDKILWKDRFKFIIPPIMFKTVEKHCQGEWLDSVKSFFYLKKQLHFEIDAMSPKYYWQCNDVTLEDVRHFFEIAFCNNVNCFYAIFILQDLIKKGQGMIDDHIVEKRCCSRATFSVRCKMHAPFALTEMYYAKVVLRHLIHTYLAVRWVKSHPKDELTPEMVVNFFLQWIDTVNLHPDCEVVKKIDELVERVDEILKAQNPKFTALSIQERLAKNIISEKQVLTAITQAIYRQRHMAVTAAANLETLNIVKVLNNRCGNVIVVAAVYHAVARRCGVACELLAFPNHLIVEWRDRSEPAREQLYTVDLGSGELKPKRRCPFSHMNETGKYKYCPDSLLQYIYSAFHMTMGAIKNMNTHNAYHLLDFLGTSNSHHNPYRNFFAYLIEHTQLPAINQPLDLTYLDDEHLEILQSLANLNPPVKSDFKVGIVRRHVSDVRYAVGMICYHKKLDYVGIIRGWDARGDASWVDRSEVELNLRLGLAQPFYYVMAADQSNRYVAQENLAEISRPTRLYHLEDAISREFSHFNGFSYVPNDEKTYEYPDEGPVAMVYCTRSHYRR